MKNIKKIVIAVFSAGILILAFQNCGESLDLESLQQTSETIRIPSAALAMGTTSMVENTSYRIDLQIQNIESYEIQWFKDGALLEGFVGDSLIFEPIQLADAGEYQVIVKTSLNTEVQTEPVTVTVSPDETLVSYTLPRVVNAARNYFLASGNTAQNDSSADAYCKHELGPAAISTNYTTNLNIEGIQYTAKAEAQAACGALPYVSGMCLRFDPGVFEPELRRFIGPFVRRFASVECRPEPITGLLLYEN